MVRQRCTCPHLDGQMTIALHEKLTLLMVYSFCALFRQVKCQADESRSVETKRRI
jgi:hypothetical protein